MFAHEALALHEVLRNYLLLNKTKINFRKKKVEVGYFWIIIQCYVFHQSGYMFHYQPQHKQPYAQFYNDKKNTKTQN